MRFISIYGLSEEGSPTVMYVGKTRRTLQFRLGRHIAHAKYGAKIGRKLSEVEKWILRTKAIIVPLASVDESTWQERERNLIAEHLLLNPLLLNRCSGGNGKDSNEEKLVCECGRDRTRFSNGVLVCKFCRAAWRKSKAGKAAYRKYNGSPKNRKNQRQYRLIKYLTSGGMTV